MNQECFKIRKMAQKEVAEIAINWAAKEGWNPGLDDAACFYAADPNGFLVGELNGQPVACISAVRYDAKFGFMGFYIVKPEYRGQGYGMELFNYAFKMMGKRNIGGDGVLERIEDYKTQGFKPTYKNRRYQGISVNTNPFMNGLVDIKKANFKTLCVYDNSVFPAKRNEFLKCWITQEAAKGFASLHYDRIIGYGLIRPCVKGYKIGPLFADNAIMAEIIFNALVSSIPEGEEFFFDVPEVNIEAVKLAEKNKMRIVFETMRIYTENPPKTALEKVFGVTSFELG